MTTTVDLRPGWNAGARSIKWCDSHLEASVEPFEDISDVVVGLSPALDVTLTHEQTHSFRFRRTPAGTFADVYERGEFAASLGGYVEGDVYKLRRADGVVTYYKNNALVYTSAVPSTGRVYLAAALYLGGDKI